MVLLTKMKINQTEKTFIVVFIVGTGVFFYYFFILPPTPVYYDNSSMVPVPRDAEYLDDGRIIIGYSRPSAVIVAPVAVTFYFFMILVTDGGRIRLREIIDFGDGFTKLKQECKNKIKEGKDQYQEWKKNKRV